MKSVGWSGGWSSVRLSSAETRSLAEAENQSVVIAPPARKSSLPRTFTGLNGPFKGKEAKSCKSEFSVNVVKAPTYDISASGSSGCIDYDMSASGASAQIDYCGEYDNCAIPEGKVISSNSQAQARRLLKVKSQKKVNSPKPVPTTSAVSISQIRKEKVVSDEAEDRLSEILGQTASKRGSVGRDTSSEGGESFV